MSLRSLPSRGEVAAAPRPWTGGEVSERATGRVRDYLHLLKARLSTMVVASAVVGYWLAASDIELASLLWFTLGTFFVVGGANAFNQIVEREPDALMERTARRPLPTGRISVREAASAASLLTVIGLGLVLASGGATSALLGLAALLMYVLVYTPMKSRTRWATFPGAISGAIPTLMGWSAAQGGIDVLGWCLFGVLFFWQFPHTFAVAATYREDYERVGYCALPGRARGLQVVGMTVAVLAVSLAPAALGLLGPAYGVGALVLGTLFLAASIRFGDGTVKSRATALLTASLFYLPSILALAAFVGKVN